MLEAKEKAENDLVGASQDLKTLVTKVKAAKEKVARVEAKVIKTLHATKD